MKRFLTITLIALMALTGVFANGTAESTPAAQEKVELEFFCWGAAETTTQAAFKAMIEGFETKYPNIHVTVTESNYDAVNTTLRNRAAAGDAPDVAQVSNQWVATLQAMDALLPMDDILSAGTMKDFYDGAKAGTTIKGKTYSAPWIMQPCELYYNKDLLAKAGYTAPPKDWKEMNEMAYAIAKLGKDASGNKIYGRSLNSKLLANAGYGSLPDVWGYGGNLTDASGNVVFNSPETITAYANLQKEVRDGVAPAGIQIVDCRTLFQNGLVAFHVDAPSQTKNFGKVNFGVQIIDTYSSDHHLVAFKNSKHPKECALLIDYLSGPEGMTKYTDNCFVIPARHSVENLPYYKTLDANLMQFFKGAASARSLPVQSPDFVAAMEGVAQGLQRIVINNEDVKTVVADTDAMLKKYY